MVFIASDHAGFALKEQLKNFLSAEHIAFEDLGPASFDPQDDYPDFAVKLAQKVVATGGIGILICATGQGTALAANKVKGARAYLAWNEYTATHARSHGDANILTLGAKTIDENTAKKIVTIFLKEPFSGAARHQRRLAKIAQIENSNS